MRMPRIMGNCRASVPRGSARRRLVGVVVLKAGRSYEIQCC